MVVLVAVERVGRGLDAGLDVNVTTFRLVVVTALAADAGPHVLTHVRLDFVCLIGLGVGVDVGLVVAAVRFLVAIRIGLSAFRFRILLRLRIRAPGVPVSLLMNLIAGVDVDVGAFSLVVRVNSILGLLLMSPVLTPSPPLPALLPPV